MDWNIITRFFRQLNGNGQSHFVLPSFALEIEPGFLAGARLDGSSHSVRRLGVRNLGPGTIVPSPNAPNIINGEDLRGAMRGLTEAIGNSGGRWGLLLPDACVRVAILNFETLPEQPKEVEALVGWKMKQILPFPLEEARITHQIIWNDPGDVGVMAVAAKGALLAEYKQSLGLDQTEPVLILPASIALLPLLPASENEGQLLIHVTSAWITTTASKGGRLRFWRTKKAESGMEGLSADVTSEVNRVLASCRDHLQIEIERIVLCSRPQTPSELASEVGRAASREIHSLAIPAGSATRMSEAEHALFESVGAPFAGLLANAS